MAVASLIISLLAMAVAVISWLDSRRRPARSTPVPAGSPDAAELTAEATAEPLPPSTAQEISFRIERVGRHEYALRNVGTKIATGVAIDVEGGTALSNVPTGANLEPGQEAGFVAIGDTITPMPGSVRVVCDQLPDAVRVAIPAA
jgi:hypothetical protein